MNLSFFIHTNLGLSPAVPPQTLLDAVTSVSNAHLVDSKRQGGTITPASLENVVSTFLDSALSPADRIKVRAYVVQSEDFHTPALSVYLNPACQGANT